MDCLLRWHTIPWGTIICVSALGRALEDCVNPAVTIVSKGMWRQYGEYIVFIMAVQSSVSPTNGQKKPRHGVLLSLWYTYIRIT